MDHFNDNPMNISHAVVLIKSSDSSNSMAGTGFVIHCDENECDQNEIVSYIVTCAHVVDFVGGDNKVRAAGFPATMKAGDAAGQGLVILSVKGLRGIKPLTLQFEAEEGQAIIIPGFKQDGVRRSLRGTLGRNIGFAVEGQGA